LLLTLAIGGGDLATLNAYLTTFGSQGLQLPPNYVVKPLQVLPITIRATDPSFLRKAFSDIKNARALNPNARLREKWIRNLTRHPMYQKQLALDFNNLLIKLDKDYKNYLSQL